MPPTPRAIVQFGYRIYGVFGWIALMAITLPTIAALALLPGQARRRALVRRSAKAVLRLMGTPPAVSGLGNLPHGPCIVVANHASYLDGIILTAVLPPRFCFVIKREMTNVPLAHYMLRRIGSEFVERYDSRRGAADARRILTLAATRQSLAFFPEGTFRVEPGLRRFHNGAFVAALRGGVPLVPVAIRGSRDMLSAEHWLPRPGRLEVIIKSPIQPSAQPEPIAQLIGECRRSILEELPEPDMAG